MALDIKNLNNPFPDRLTLKDFLDRDRCNPPCLAAVEIENSLL
jgi:hypothetical protein